MVGNVLIAVATMILSASGTLAGRLGKDRAFAVTLLVGICVLFAGFLIAIDSSNGHGQGGNSSSDQAAP